MARFNVIFRSLRGQTTTEEITSQQLFGEFIHQNVSTLIERGLLKTGELYRYHITPRYDNAPQYGREVIYLETPERNWLKDDGRPGWYSEQQVKQQPLRYFTLTLRTAPRGFVYKKDFPLSSVKEIISNWIQSKNVGTAPTTPVNQEWDWELVALKDEVLSSYDLKPEEELSDSVSVMIVLRPSSQLATDASVTTQEEPLVISVDDISTSEVNPAFEDALDISVEDMAVELAVKPLPPGPYERQGTKMKGDLSIFVPRNTLEAIVQETTKKEYTGGRGILIGEPFKEETTGEIVVQITNHISSRVARDRSFWFTADVWSAILHVKEQRFPNAQIVGWYRDHIVGTRLSMDDEFIHKNFFKEPWHVVLVLDRFEGTRRFFQWKGGQVVPCESFQIIS